MSLKIDKKELDRKSKIIDNAIIQLKKEFVGIDEQIDTVMNNVRVWYLYPQLQVSPCVVNIFGMTGCGKSSLVRRIAQLLEIEKNLVYFNFCAISEQNSWEIEQEIEEQLDNECSSRMFVYDEFQYAATLDANMEEKDNKHGLKPFWELLDTGILHKRISFWEIRDVFKVLAYMIRINTVCPMDISNGVWVNSEECLKNFNSYDCQQFSQVFNVKGKKEEEGGFHRLSDGHNLVGVYDTCQENDFFIREHILRRFTELYRKAYNKVCDAADVYQMLCNMNMTAIYDLFNEVYELSQKGYDLKFNDSIIFVIANLDEAYNVAFDVNPDMSPDQFNQVTKKISVVDIKKALQRRFRNEQIARLGNIHIIYPSFSSESFRKIIDLHLDAYAKTAKDLCGLDVEFDKNIKNMIFDEAVYPTHGTRPIFSSIHEIIKTKLPHIIRNICDNEKCDDATYIQYSYNKKNKKSVINVLDSNRNVIDTYKFTNKLRLESLRTPTKDEQQANTAVHESGHFVVYSYLNGRIPEKLVSRTTESGTSGFMMNDIVDEENQVGSKLWYLNEIKVCLGGYVAEGMIFGDEHRSGGASSDLGKATQLASNMVRLWGLWGLPFVTTHLSKHDTASLINEDDQKYINDKIKDIINLCLEDVVKIIKKPHIKEMLISSAKYLSQHSQMPKHLMKELFDKAKNNGEMCENNETYYRDIVNNL